MKEPNELNQIQVHSDFKQSILKYTFPLYRSIPVRLHDDFEDLVRIGIVGEGPAGLAAVLSILKQTSLSDPEQQEKLRIKWYCRKPNEYTRRHLVTIAPNEIDNINNLLGTKIVTNQDNNCSIRSIEHELNNVIRYHPLFEKHVEIRTEYDKYENHDDLDQIIVADGFNSRSRDRIFFDGQRYLPATFLTQKKLIMYLNLPNAQDAFSETEELEQSTSVKKVMFDKNLLENAGINVDILIDGLKVIFECPVKDKVTYWVTGFESLEKFIEQIKANCNNTETYLSNNKTQTPYFEKFDLSNEVKTLLKDNPSEFFAEFRKNFALLESFLKKQYSDLSEQKSIIVVPIMPKLATFGMKGYVSMNAYQQVSWLVGDAAIAFPAGSTGLSTGMVNSAQLASTLIQTTLDINDISKQQLEANLQRKTETPVDKFRQFKIRNASVKGGDSKDISQSFDTAMTKFFRSCFDSAPQPVRELVEVYNAHQMETFMREAIRLENQGVLSLHDESSKTKSMK